jgi:hypothetical protein
MMCKRALAFLCGTVRSLYAASCDVARAKVDGGHCLIRPVLRLLVRRRVLAISPPHTLLQRNEFIQGRAWPSPGVPHPRHAPQLAPGFSGSSIQVASVTFTM